EEHPRCYEAKGSKVEEKLVHLMMVVKFKVLIEKKRMCSLGLMRFDWLMEFLKNLMVDDFGLASIKWFHVRVTVSELSESTVLVTCLLRETLTEGTDRTDFASWQQLIRLYCWGKENGVNILKSIDEGPFQMGTLRETLTEGTEGVLHLGPERPRVYSDLTSEEKDRYNVDIRARNILLQGLPKDIYSLINHYTDAKDIWDNVKMLLEGMQLNSKFVNNMLPEWGRIITAVKLNIGLRDSNYDQLYAYLKQHEGRQNRGQGNNARDAGATGYGGAQNRVGNANSGQARKIKFYNCNALNVDNVFQADDCDAFDSDVNEAPTAQTMFMANISFADPIYDEAGLSYDSNILSEYVKDNAVPVVQSSVSSVPNDAYMMILNDMHEQPAQHVSITTPNNVVDNLLSAELATYKEQVELYERRAEFELTKREQKIDE
nr:integrase, catalytic region, zinc finger, CCHC-type, peptidase aspartic, catalytic [Tanacetum cinerariifolium]